MRSRAVIAAVLFAAGSVTVGGVARAAAEGQVTAAPTTGLGWRADVEVRVTDAPPGVRLRISECFDDGDADADCILLGTTRVTDAGKARHTVTVQRFVIGEEDGGDCWRAGTTCRVRVDAEAPGSFGGSVPLTFDPTTPPPPPPLVTVTPATDLAGRQTVTVQATGVLGDGRVRLEECAPEGSGRPCLPLGQGIADAEGRFDASVTVTRLVGGFPFDCATSSVPCRVRLVHEAGAVDAPLAFDPADALPPQPVLIASPTTNLFTDDRIVAVGHGFTADWLVAAGECVAGVTAITQCDTGNVVFATPRNGSVLFSLAARPIITTPDVGVVDCRAAPGSCVLTAVTFSSIAQTAVVPLTFSSSDAPSLVVHDGAATEGRDEMRAEVTLSEPSASTITVEYVTHHDSARAGTDYVRKRSHLVFRPGETRHVVRVALVDDRVAEPTERFRIEVEEADGAHVSVGSGLLTITDDD